MAVLREDGIYKIYILNDESGHTFIFLIPCFMSSERGTASFNKYIITHLSQQEIYILGFNCLVKKSPLL